MLAGIQFTTCHGAPVSDLAAYDPATHDEYLSSVGGQPPWSEVVLAAIQVAGPVR